MPCRSRRELDQRRGRASPRSARATPSSWPKPNSKIRKPPGCRRGRRLLRSAAAMTVEAVGAAEERDRRLVVAHLRLQRRRDRPRARREGSRRSGRTVRSSAARAGRRATNATRSATPCRAGVRGARPRARRARCRWRRRRARGRSCASATARQPLPVPMSAIVERRVDVGKQLQGRFDDELGFGTRDQHGRRDLERAGPRTPGAPTM